MTKTDTNIPELVINTLTNAEYEAAKQAGEISSTELYMTTDDPDYITEDQLENKQDVLVSGTNIKTINNQSLLGSGNIDIQGGSSTAEEIVNANESTGATSPLKVWQGTEQEYNQGEITEWKNWKTDTVVKGTLTNSGGGTSIAYGNGLWVGISLNATTAKYTTNGSFSWSNSNTLPYTQSGGSWSPIVAFGLGKFIIIVDHGSSYIYSEDGINWTEGTFPLTGKWRNIVFGGGKFIANIGDSTNYVYSEDGINWSTGTFPITLSSNDDCIAYVNDKFMTVSGTTCIYSTDGINWTSSALPTNYTGGKITYGKGLYLIIRNPGSPQTPNNYLYSTDLINWTTGNIDFWWNPYIAFNGEYFLVTAYNNTDVLYSSDGLTWTQVQVYTSNTNDGLFIKDNDFIAVRYTNVYTIKLTNLLCYTLDQEPTTSSTVYSTPGIESTLTITAIDITNNTVTLSDNNIYNRNSAEDTETYRSIGEIHPDYICNINNVGVKIGNTTIADNTTLDTVPTQGSTNAITSGAVYEVLGNLETALYNFNSRTE